MIVQNRKRPELVGVQAVELRQGFVVHVTFTDGTERDMDLDRYIGHGPVFAPIRRDSGLFHQVYVDPETETLTWPNGADIAPETLYYDGPPPWATAKEAAPSRARRARVATRRPQKARTRARAAGRR